MNSTSMSQVVSAGAVHRRTAYWLVGPECRSTLVAGTMPA